MQRTYSKFLIVTSIVSAAWYITNEIIHLDLNIPTIAIVDKDSDTIRELKIDCSAFTVFFCYQNNLQNGSYYYDYCYMYTNEKNK